jgi:low temperature requirement protein LtrA
MIILLGEAVTQVVIAASGRQWNSGMARAAAAAFLLLVGLWWLTFQYGFAASPESKLAQMPARFGLPLHFLTTGGIVFLSSGLGETVAEPWHRMPSGQRWLAAGGLAGYFLATAVAAVAIGASRRWLLCWALPTVLEPVAVGIWGGPLAGWGVAALLLVAVAWQSSYGWLVEGRLREQAAGHKLDHELDHELGHKLGHPEASDA